MLTPESLVPRLLVRLDRPRAKLTATCGPSKPNGPAFFKRDKLTSSRKRTPAEEMIQARQFKPRSSSSLLESMAAAADADESSMIGIEDGDVDNAVVFGEHDEEELA